jgi:hypothetical protein
MTNKKYIRMMMSDMLHIFIAFLMIVWASWAATGSARGNPFSGFSAAHNAMSGSRLGMVESIGGRKREDTENGLDLAMQIAVEICGDGTGVVQRLIEFITDRQKMYNANLPENWNFVRMVTILNTALVYDIYQDMELVQRVEDLIESRGKWWVIQNIPVHCPLHDPFADCEMYWDGLKLGNLLRLAGGYFRYHCNPLIVPHDPIDMVRGILNEEGTCYASSALQMFARIPGAPQACLARNLHLTEFKSRKALTIRGAAVAMAELCCGDQNEPIWPGLVYSFLKQAGWVRGDRAGGCPSLLFRLLLYTNGTIVEDDEAMRYEIPIAVGGAIVKRSSAGDMLSASFDPNPPYTWVGGGVVDALNEYRIAEQTGELHESQLGDLTGHWKLPAQSMGMKMVVVGVTQQEDEAATFTAPVRIPPIVSWVDEGPAGRWLDGNSGSRVYSLYAVIVQRNYNKSHRHSLLLVRTPTCWRVLNDDRVQELEHDDAMKVMHGGDDQRSAADFVFYMRDGETVEPIRQGGQRSAIVTFNLVD